MSLRNRWRLRKQKLQHSQLKECVNLRNIFFYLLICSVSSAITVTDEVVEVAAEVVQTVENVRLFMVRTVTEVALTVEAIRTFIVATITFLVNLVVDILRFITGKLSFSLWILSINFFPQKSGLFTPVPSSFLDSVSFSMVIRS